MIEKPTKVALNEEARARVWKGVKAIYDPVRLTLGPEGGNALLPRTYNRGNRTTNDGVSVAKMIEPVDEFEQEVAHQFREAAEKTNQKVGDGTTSTIVIAATLIKKAFSLLSQGSSIIGAQSGGVKRTGVMKLRRDMKAAQKDVLAALEKKVKKVESLEQLVNIAKVAVEDEEIGEELAKMIWEIGVDGFVDVTDGFKGGIETEVIKGMRLPAKVAAKGFVNFPKKFEMVATDTRVIITNYSLDNADVVAGFINPLLTNGVKKISIIAPAFSQNVIQALWSACYVVDSQNPNVRIKTENDIFPILTPALQTVQFEDFSVYVGARFINKDLGIKLSEITEADLGFAEKIVVKDSEAREDATIVGGKGEKDEILGMSEGRQLAKKNAVVERIEMLRGQIEETKVEIHKKFLEKRIASITAAVGVVRVGAASDAEGLYLKLKIEDAVYACKAALQEGYVKGGGLCLKEIAEELPQSVLTEALKAPYEQIQQNADGELEIGPEIIDPAKVVRMEVEHAISVTSTMATLKILVVEPREKNPAEGYEAIAKAINLFTRLQGRQWGLIRENQEEIDADTAALYEKYQTEEKLG